MKVKILDDLDQVKNILTHPEIYKTIGGDGKPDVSRYEPPDDPSIFYLGGIVDSNVIGVMVVHLHNLVTAEVHIQVLPYYRKKYSILFGNECLHWLSEYTDLKKLVAQVPTAYPNVLAFAMSNGFTKEGVNRASYQLNGQLFDQVYLGLKRGENHGFC